jgi:hypothetical protein
MAEMQPARRRGREASTIAGCGRAGHDPLIKTPGRPGETSKRWLIRSLASGDLAIIAGVVLVASIPGFCPCQPVDSVVSGTR